MGPFLTELFPTSIRGTAQGFCFNAGRAVGALFPTVVGYLSTSMELGKAIGLFTVGAYVLLIAAALLLPETNGMDLAADIEQYSKTGRLREAPSS
jgi:hypothetical protein